MLESGDFLLCKHFGVIKSITSIMTTPIAHAHPTEFMTAWPAGLSKLGMDFIIQLRLFFRKLKFYQKNINSPYDYIRHFSRCLIHNSGMVWHALQSTGRFRYHRYSSIAWVWHMWLAHANTLPYNRSKIRSHTCICTDIWLCVFSWQQMYTQPMMDTNVSIYCAMERNYKWLLTLMLDANLDLVPERKCLTSNVDTW